MKTIFNFKNFLKFCLIIIAIAFIGCKDNEDLDPRQAFLGTYKMDDFELHVFATDGTDSTFEISNNSEIEFETDNDLDADELKMDLEEFLADVLSSAYAAFIPGVTASVDIDDDQIVEISGNNFDLDDFDFNLTLTNGSSTATYPGDIEGSGEINGDEISFDFEIEIYPGGTVTFEGNIEGEKD